MIFIGIFLMWAVVCLIRCMDRELCFHITQIGFMKWTVINMAAYIVFYFYSMSVAMALLSTVYFVTTALIDYYSGYVYSLFSSIMASVLFLIYFCSGNPGEYHLFIIFYLYLKTLELFRAYGGGDTDYLFCLYIFNSIISGKSAVTVTVCTLLSAVIMHTVIYHGRINERVPFTPAILASAVLVLLICTGRSRIDGNI